MPFLNCKADGIPTYTKNYTIFPHRKTTPDYVFSTIFPILLLIIPAIGSTVAQGAASTTSDGKYASGTIDFSTIGTLSANTTYWNNGVKFYSGSSASISASTSAWDETISIPAYISNKKFGNKTTASNKWGSNGAGKQYISSGFACSQHAIGIHVNSACTITVIVDKNIGSNTDDAGITASIDGVAYGAAYTSSNYYTAGSTALTVTSSRADATNYPGRYTLTINVTEANLTDGEAVVKMSNNSSGSGAGKLFCWESVTVTPATPTTTTLTVDPDEGSVYVGKTLDIHGYVDTNSNATVTYMSSNASVATVTSAGVISGKAAGSATITVSQDANASYTAGSATFKITVNAAPTQYTVTLASSPAAGGSVSGKYNTADAYNGKAINNDFSSGDEVSENTRLTLTASPNTGYQFANSWGGSSATTATFTTATTTSNKTYTANFSAMTYTVTIDENTGTAGDATVTATYDAALPSFIAPTKAGNTLSGYYTETSGGTKVINADGTLVTGVAGYTDGSGNWKHDGDVTLYALWEESVTPSGGTVTITYMSTSPGIFYSPTGTGITSTSTASGKSNTDGHTLSNGQVITVSAGSSGKVITGITVTYSRYNNKTEFAIVGSGTTTAAYSVTSKTGTWAGTANTITITGTASSSPDRITSIAVTYSDGGAVTKHSVTYALGGGSGTVPTQEDVAENASFVVAAADDITPPIGKTFMYWSDGVNNYAPGSYYTMGTSDVILTAYYGYNITYTDANEKGTMPATVVGTALTSEILAAEPTAIDDGYEFEGWYTNSTFTTKATAGAIGADTPLYANYKITGTISSSPSGAVVSGQAITTTATGDAITGMYIAQAADEYTADVLKGTEKIEGKVANWTITNSVSGALKLSVLLTDGTFYSDVLTNTFTVGVSAPVITCANNIVTMTCATDGATIYYTTNGNTPTSSSTAYNPAAKPTITENTTFKAIAKKGGVSSAVTTESFAYTTIATETTLFHTDFTTADNWTTETISGASNERTINDTKVTFGCNSSGNDHKVYVNTSGGGSLTFENKKMECSAGSVKSGNPKHFMAIHLTGVNGSITVNFGDVSKAWYYTYDDGSEGTVIARQTSSTGTSFTIENLKSDKVTLYLGQDNTTITELTITTPKTRLTANPEKVSFIGKTGSKVVRVSTNSTGTVSIKTDPTSSIATITDDSYNSTTKIYTMTVNAVNYGETEVVMQVPRSGDYPAKEITIPIEVVQPEITIDTAPQDITFAQNDAAEKKFTVAASTTTGGEVSYQWYTCDASGNNKTEIAGAISGTYILSTTQKAATGDFYYTCKLSSSGCEAKYTSQVKATVTAIEAGTYNATVYYVAPGKTLTYTDLSGWTLTSSPTYCTANLSAGGTLTIEGTSFSDDKKDVLTLTKDAETITINVSVKKHKVTLVWSEEMKQFGESDGLNPNDVLYNGDDIKRLPYLKARLYEDGTTPYTGKVIFYSDDKTIAYFGEAADPKTMYEQTNGSKPTVRYGGGQGGCKFYAYIDNTVEGIDSVKTSYDLRVQMGYSNDLPSGRKVEVQQQYTLWKDATDKLVTVTYGGYKYNDHKWEKTDSKGKTSTVTDAWGTATNYVGKDKAIDGYLYAVRNKDNDAADEYKHAIQENGEFSESAWYKTTDEGNPGGVTGDYQRIKPFRLPCRASYITFTPHVSGTLTAYVYQNGIVGRGGSANQLASGPRLGYWFDEEGWVQNPTAVLTKQTIANANARDKREYSSYSDMDAQMKGYWTNAADQIIVKMLRSKYCHSLDEAAMKDPDNYELDELACDTEGKPYSRNETYYSKDNPYYWGDSEFVTDNNAKVVPTPEKPILHQGGYMIVNEGYVKYTLNVEAGKTYYFFGKMTKVGYAGMNFVPADPENREASLTLDANDIWPTKFGGMTQNTIYGTVTVPSNYRIGKWNTICLPFAVSENQVEQVFGKGTELAIFNGLRHDTENHVYYIKYLRHVDQNILPGQPYLIYPTGRAVAERTNQENGGMAETGEEVPTVGDIIGTGSTGNVRLTFHNVIINKGVTAQSYGSNTDADGTTSYVFTGTDGTDQKKEIAKYDLYIAPKKGTLNRYMPSNPDAKMTLNTYHAFIKANDSQIMQDAITFAFSEDDIEKAWDPTTWRGEDDVDPGEATGIVIIEDVTDGGNYSYAGRATNGKTYNLMGQEVDPRSAKGIVIVNGKKVMY